uniref:NADH-ubiquinone oxidoreductase chain 6 n=1 Tax=Lunella correensis TaxID=2683703 RepID=A0A6B9MYE8_9VEST|nr:NADH dehydrogenase subunit 6 [Lunella correensis]QHD20090.1 NADH dehydrogenase subunit 6 [Lunella correensis]QUV72917.1 NADH dehydrogenase subunit 6 [Lunella correensis]QYF08449.1 NADH dehydrogenase subunit 6 [Lunella correensis]
MSVIITSSLCFSLTLLLPTMTQPLSLGLCIMIYSVTASILLGIMVASWYSYVLFLVYVGGLLVMFAYVSALAPNNFFSSLNSIFGFLVSFIMILLTLLFLHTPDSSSLIWLDQLSLSKKTLSSGEMLINPSEASVVIFLGVILLINLLAVVKVCYYQQGPLRSHFELK